MENSLATLSLKGLTGGWSKHGGASDSLIKEKIHGEWNCQSCAKIQPESLNPYIFQYGDLFLRVCNKCINNGCVILLKRKMVMEIDFS
jgi:hypothetical protein